MKVPIKLEVQCVSHLAHVCACTCAHMCQVGFWDLLYYTDISSCRVCS